MAGVAECSPNSGASGKAKVRIFKDDHRIFSAEFKHRRCEILRCGLCDPLSRRDRSGKHQLVRRRVDQPFPIAPQPQVGQGTPRRLEPDCPPFGDLDPVRDLLEITQLVLNQLEIDEARRPRRAPLHKRMDGEASGPGGGFMAANEELVFAAVQKRVESSVLDARFAVGLGGAITASSANRSGAPAALTAAEVIAQLAPAVDLVLDAGAVTSPIVSTILDVTVEPPCLYRPGKIAQHTLEAVLGSRVTQKKVDTRS